MIKLTLLIIMKYKLFSKKEKRFLTKQETINLFKILNDKVWPIKIFFSISLFFCLDLILIGFFTLNYTTFLLIFFVLIYSIIHIILILKLIDHNAIEDFEYLPKEEAYIIAEELISFIEKKGTRGTNRIQNMKKKIKLERFYNKIYNVFYIINFILLLIIFEIVTLDSINIVIYFFLEDHSLNPQYISNLFIIVFISYFYFSIIFSIDYKNVRNARRIGNLLEIAFLRDFNNCIDNIKNILSEDLEKIDIDDLVNQFNNWYAYYLGKYFNKKELDNILFDFHDYYVDLDNEKYFYDLFLGIKIRFQDKRISLKNSEREKNESKYNFLINKIENFLILLEYKINTKVINKQEKDRLMKYFGGLASFMLTIIGIFAQFPFS